jgi:D-sedoheptulose 7-phosphate isomerase
MATAPQFLTRTARFAELLDAMSVTGPDGRSVDIEDGLDALCRSLEKARAGESSVYLVGNGGSAAVVSHIANDFINVAALRASTLHEPAVMTCQANDFGYDKAFARQLDIFCRAGDVVIAVSSSGNSENIRNAVDAARRRGAFVATLSGFRAENPLRSMGDLNFWLSATDYGLVEIGHLFILHNVAERLRDNRCATPLMAAAT